MVSKIYEIRVLKDGREVRDMPAFLDSIDLDDGDRTRDTLNRHVLGAALRAGAHRREIHRFHLEFRAIDGDGKGRGPVMFRHVPPAAEDA